MSTLLRPNLRTEQNKCNFTLSLATWNVRGLTATEKRQQLGRDCAKYHLDLICLQETKVVVNDVIELASRQKLVLIQQQTAKYRGLGFVIAPRLKPFVRRWWYVSDRVAVLYLAIPCRDGTLCHYRVVNAYGPTSLRVRENPSVSDQLYAELNSAIKAPARFLVFVCGDFNSKLGKRTTTDIDAGLDSCMGAHGMGTRNDNGEALVSFMAVNGFFACNTAFQHASRHKTTWTGWLKDQNAPPGSSKTIAIYTQIDFVLCKQNAKLMLQDA